MQFDDEVPIGRRALPRSSELSLGRCSGSGRLNLERNEKDPDGKAGKGRPEFPGYAQ